MAMHVAVVGSGARAGEWATRFLASGFDVVANDPTVADTVTICWPLADRMGLFPGASPDRLRISDDPAVIAGARLVQVVGDAPVPVTDGLVATDRGWVLPDASPKIPLMFSVVTRRP